MLKPFWGNFGSFSFFFFTKIIDNKNNAEGDYFVYIS